MFTGVWLFGAKDKRVLPSICNAVSKSRTQGKYSRLFFSFVPFQKIKVKLKVPFYYFLPYVKQDYILFPDYADVLQPVIKWRKNHMIVGDDTQQEEEAPPTKVFNLISFL